MIIVLLSTLHDSRNMSSRLCCESGAKALDSQLSFKDMFPVDISLFFLRITRNEDSLKSLIKLRESPNIEMISTTRTCLQECVLKLKQKTVERFDMALFLKTTPIAVFMSVPLVHNLLMRAFCV